MTRSGTLLEGLPFGPAPAAAICRSRASTQYGSAAPTRWVGLKGWARPAGRIAVSEEAFRGRQAARTAVSVHVRTGRSTVLRP